MATPLEDLLFKQANVCTAAVMTALENVLDKAVIADLSVEIGDILHDSRRRILKEIRQLPPLKSGSL